MADGTSESQNTNYDSLGVDDFFKLHVEKTDDGYKLPEDAKSKMSDTRYQLVNTEARRRTTEANLARERNKTLELQAKLAAQENFLAKPTVQAEEQQRLDDLKLVDPDAWLIEMNAHNAKAQEEFKTTLDSTYAEKLKELQGVEATKTASQFLGDFNASNEQKLTAEMLQNDIPPRLHTMLQDGKITQAEFLADAHAIVYGKKVAANPSATNREPSFNGTPGAADGQESKSGTLKDLYENTIF